jgi:hypothetical protein
LTLRTDDFYLGTEDYHIAGTADRIAIVDPKIHLLSDNILVSDHDGNIKIENISTASEDINSTVALSNAGAVLSANRIDLTTANGVYVNNKKLNLTDTADIVQLGDANPVSANAVAVEINKIGPLIDSKIDAIPPIVFPTVENEVKSGGSNAVNSKAVIAYVAGGIDAIPPITIEDTIITNGTNAVNSKAVIAYTQGQISAIPAPDSIVSSSSNNSVSGSAVYSFVSGEFTNKTATSITQSDTKLTPSSVDYS